MNGATGLVERHGPPHSISQALSRSFYGRGRHWESAVCMFLPPWRNMAGVRGTANFFARRQQGASCRCRVDNDDFSSVFTSIEAPALEDMGQPPALAWSPAWQEDTLWNIDCPLRTPRRCKLAVDSVYSLSLTASFVIRRRLRDRSMRFRSTLLTRSRLLRTLEARPPTRNSTATDDCRRRGRGVPWRASCRRAMPIRPMLSQVRSM